MGRVVSQLDLERDMLDVLDVLEDLVEKYRDAGREAAEAESLYRSTHAKAYLRADDAMGKGDGKLATKTREIYADHIAADEFHDWRVKDTVARYTREAIQTKRARLDILRSLNSNLRPLVGPSG